MRDAIDQRVFKDEDGVEHKGLDAVLARLLEMLFAKGTSPRDAVALAKEILDRGFGKAKQTVNVTGDTAAVATMPRDPAEMTDEEIAQARAAIQKLRELAVVHADTEH